MISVSLITNGNLTVGFEVKGHSMNAESGQDIICAFVSSACYMTANTITEILGINASAKVDDGYMLITIPVEQAESAQDILNGFSLHMTELAKDYPKNVKVI